MAASFINQCRGIIVAMPKNVIPNVPTRWSAINVIADPIRPDCSKETVSAENVENVVSPPSKPVTTNNRHSGANMGCVLRYAIAMPIRYPPSKLAVSVPRGIVEKILFRPLLSSQRTRQPNEPPRHIARIELSVATSITLCRDLSERQFALEQYRADLFQLHSMFMKELPQMLFGIHQLETLRVMH